MPKIKIIIRKGNALQISYNNRTVKTIDYTALIESGHVNAKDLSLTPKGELRLHQLMLMEWMVKHPKEKR